MRALVISDTHFGAWTGEDLLRHDHELALLAPHLDDIDEVIFLGDLSDFLFASVPDAVAGAGGLLDLLREKLPGKRLVFLAGNHDDHLIAQEAEQLFGLELATGKRVETLGSKVRAELWFQDELPSNERDGAASPKAAEERPGGASPRLRLTVDAEGSVPSVS